MAESIHKSVLLNETIDGLNLDSKKILIDGTFGGGGHCREALKRYPGLKVIAIDQDEEAIKRGRAEFKGQNVEFLNTNFSNLPETNADAIIFDLGLSSDQLENSGRGFSFKKDEPLLMTMKAHIDESDLSAKEIVNTWEEKNLADIIYGYGEEKFARRIARAIVERREKQDIETTSDLVRIIAGAVPVWYQRGRIHFATRTFQALRIAVNDELGSLEKGLRQGFKILNPGGRMAVITFHSLEDRIVKNFFKTLVGEGLAKLVNKKPIIAEEEEITNNPRSRSAKLRIIEKNEESHAKN